MDSRVTICFGRWADLKSRIIRWITKSEWSHVWIEYNSERWNSRLVVHADSKGVIIEPKSSFLERRKQPLAVVEYEISGYTSRAFALSKEYLGKDYGYWTLILNSFLLLARRLGIKNLRGVRDIGKYTCSEFTTLFIQNAGISCKLDAELTWPGKLYDWIIVHLREFKRI